MARLSDPYVKDMLNELNKVKDTLWNAGVMLNSARGSMQFAKHHKALTDREYEDIWDLIKYEQSLLTIHDRIDEIITDIKKSQSNVQQE